MHATPCINHAKFPYARLVSPDRNITPSLAPTSSAYRDVPLLLDRTERRGGGSSLRWFNVGSRLTGGERESRQYPIGWKPMQNASRRGRIGFRRGGAFSPSIRNPEFATPTGFHGLTVRGGRRKIEKIPAESLVSYFLFSFFFFWAREKTKSKVVKRNEIRGRDRIYRLAIFEKVEKFFKRRETRYATMPIRYRTRDGRYPRYYVRLIVFFFLFSHASIIATRAIIPVLFSTFFSFGRERNKKQISFNF